MKHLFKTGLVALATLLSIASCKDDDENETLASATVRIDMPADFPDTAPAFSGEVTLSSTALGKTYTATASEGVARFASIYPGVYDIQASGSMTAEEFSAAAPELATGSDILLNGVLGGAQIVKNENGSATELNLTVGWAVKSDLLISKIYCNGTMKNNGKVNNMPKYWEIYNNTAQTIYLDGLCLAQAHGNTTAQNPCELYTKYQDEATYAARIAMLPGTHGETQDIPLEAGKSLVIAWSASNFIVPEDTSDTAADKCTMNVDLTGADFEIESSNWQWVENYGDNTLVPNMEPVYDCIPSAGFLQLNQAVFIFYATKAEIDGWATGTDATSYTVAVQQTWLAKRVPNTIIIDAVETFKSGSKQQKRIPDKLDSKGVESPNNKGCIFDRKIQYVTADGRKVLQDTNNSVNDFAVIYSRDEAQYDGSHLVIRDYDKPEIQPGYQAPERE